MTDVVGTEAHDFAGSLEDAGILEERMEMQGDTRRWREVSPGMFLGTTDLRLDTPLAYQSHTFPAICLSVVLEGFATNTTEGIEGGFCPDEVWITSTGESRPTSMTIHADQPVRVVELLLTPAWSEHNRAVMDGDPTYQAMQRAMCQPVMIRRHSLDARLRQIAWSVLNPPAHGAFTNVHLDASAMSLLSILAEAFRPAEVAAVANLTAKSLERMLEIRRHIDANAAAIDSLAGLAARFAVGQSKLKQDFQRAFGISAREYLLERRLLIGRNAILRDGLSIAEAAYKAGYQHPANFTSAFTRHFGYPPSRLKS
ncbi:AraC family transcriptional regulator [Agrobacterium sp. O3.4]|uniref:AraC family transcriptional regulator n=1 Tax=Agrobacterium cucumeris TaxID=2862866 RepID=A0ABY8RKW0_9HYPH|nr:MULTISPECIES: AraC family transcriptional regulator [Rhizobium/Agrobacterium group]MCZ7472103.1 AraC family transcriptional regulator [Rhizobium rhizogenes]WHO07652.1 AraC family transcriptional regulator [Agrobacterium cucumeris]